MNVIIIASHQIPIKQQHQQQQHQQQQQQQHVDYDISNGDHENNKNESFPMASELSFCDSFILPNNCCYDDDNDTS